MKNKKIMYYLEKRWEHAKKIIELVIPDDNNVFDKIKKLRQIEKEVIRYTKLLKKELAGEEAVEDIIKEIIQKWFKSEKLPYIVWQDIEFLLDTYLWSIRNDDSERRENEGS